MHVSETFINEKPLIKCSILKWIIEILKTKMINCNWRINMNLNKIYIKRVKKGQAFQL